MPIYNYDDAYNLLNYDAETREENNPLYYFTSNSSDISRNIQETLNSLWKIKEDVKNELPKLENGEKEEENMEYRKNGVVFENNKLYFENYGQTEDNAFSTTTKVSEGDLIIFFKEQGTFSSSFVESETNCPSIVFDVGYNCITAAKISDGKIVSIPNNTSFYRTIIPNDYFKEILKQIFDNEEVVQKYKNKRFSGNSVSIKSVALELGYKYPEYKKYIKGPKCCFCNNREYDYNEVIINGENKIVCSNCLDRITQCNRCGNFSLREDSTQTRDGARLCKECSKYHFITPYHRYYPKIDFFGNNKNNEVPYLGMELEVDFGGESDTNAGEIVKILNKNNIFAYCSHDGSLNDGFEIITQPATMEYHNSIKHVYSAVMNKLKEMKYSSHNTSTCGMHVHFNRSFFGMDDTRSLSKFIFITEKFWNELVVYSRRPEFRMERYAKKIAPMRITEYINLGNKKRNHDFHYYSVNITNNDTIELRTFKGTLNVNTILATLQLVNNMAVVAKNKSLSEIKNMRFEDFLTTKYQKKYWERHKLVPDGEE